MYPSSTLCPHYSRCDLRLILSSPESLVEMQNTQPQADVQNQSAF